MKKNLLLITFVCITLLFASCSAPAQNTGTAEASGPAATEGAKATADSSLTLDGIKKAAQDAGYEVQDVRDFQLIGGVGPVAGFNVIFKDENSESYIPVLEFKNSDDAGKYAEEVNAAGYNLCIMNGKYLTITGAEYGVPVNEKEKTALEGLLGSKVMEYTAPEPVQLASAKDYAGAYRQIDAISRALDELVNKSVLLYDKTAAEGKRIGDTVVLGSLLSSIDLAFTATLSEDQTQLDAVPQVWEMFGCTDFKLEHPSADNYILTGKRAGQETTFEVKCSFDPGTGSLRLVDKSAGETTDLYEFVPLGSDRYAFQTLNSRAIVEYKDGKVRSFAYSLNKYDKSLNYDPDKDGIYGKGAAADEAWVSKLGEENFDRLISSDGTKLKISAAGFTGEKVQAEIDVQ